MTVKELIETLQDYPEDKEVIVYDSESDVFREVVEVDDQDGNPVLIFDTEWQMQP